MANVPKTQRAFVQASPGGPIHLATNHPVTQPEDLAPGQCLVKLEFSGVCHSDLCGTPSLLLYLSVLTGW